MASRRSPKQPTPRVARPKRASPPPADLAGLLLAAPALFGELADAVAILDLDYRLRYQNPVQVAWMGDHLGETCFQAFEGRDAACEACPLTLTLADGARHSGARCARVGGVERYLESTTSPLRDAQGRLVGAVKVSRDVTTRVESDRVAQAQAERLALHARHTPLAYIEFTPSLVVTEWNPAAERLFGYTREEALGRSAYDLIVPRDVAPVAEQVSLALGVGSGGVRSDNENVTRSGRRISCEWHNTPLRQADGRVVGIASMAQDVTARVEAERALVRSETKLRAIFDHSRDAIGLSVEGTHTFVNPAYVQLFGYDRAEDLVGRSILDLIAPESRPEIAERVRRRAQGLAVPARYQTHGLRRDGTRFEMDVGVTHFDQGGQTHTLVFLRDVTERNQAQKALEASERRFRALIESSADVITVIDPTGRVAYHSPSYQRVMGHDPGVRAGQSMLELVHPDDLEGARAAFARILQAPGNLERVTLRSRHVDGTWRWLEVTATNHLDDPAVGGVVVNHRDVTAQIQAAEDREKLERQMQHVQKLESLGVLAGGIAHDFNNILMAVLGHAGLALAELSPVSPVRDNIGEIEKAARRAADLTKQMLAYSGKGRFVVRPLDLREVVVEMTHMLEVSISKKAVLRFNFAPQVPPVLADAAQMRQVIMNLVINASEAIGDRSGVIALTTGAMPCDRDYLSSTYLDEHLPEGTYVFLEIADTGCGMDRETLARIFEPFFSTKFTGRGLGLAAVLGIVRGHKGALRVYSEPGKGTTFKMLFPAADQPAEPLPNGVAPEGWHGTGTVLLVDDEETVRAVGKKMLQHLGFTVLTAENGREAVERYREHHAEIRAVLLDLTMPHMDGEETFRELRRIRSDVPVVLSSGYNESEVTQRFAGKGLAGFMQKPYNLGELSRQLRAIFEKG